ncbi:MAG TPA: DnaA regulatory inactivator Hda [Mizugakiibacter sp.]|nr:DnaA regulatory inactivator Hda [Mizugakiibacter sp.]
MCQIPLDLQWPARRCFEYFYAGASNAAALNLVRSAAQTQGPWVFLQGPSGSGRTHLLMAACREAANRGLSAQYIPLRSLRDRQPERLRGFAGANLLALDDLDTLFGDGSAEQALFDLYNTCRAAGNTLLMASLQVPTAAQLPDLRSRLGACAQARLHLLDDAGRREVLRRQAAVRGLELDDSVLDWLFHHHARDLGTLMALLERIDHAALAEQRRITVPLIRRLLAS